MLEGHLSVGVARRRAFAHRIRCFLHCLLPFVWQDDALCPAVYTSTSTEVYKYAPAVEVPQGATRSASQKPEHCLSQSTTVRMGMECFSNEPGLIVPKRRLFLSRSLCNGRSTVAGLMCKSKARILSPPCLVIPRTYGVQQFLLTFAAHHASLPPKGLPESANPWVRMYLAATIRS